MSAILSALDNATSKKFGENGHVEHSWSNNIDEKIVQYFFQLVRSKQHGDLIRQLSDILHRLKGHEDTEQFSMIYRLIGQTRDLVNGKGERDLTYMQIFYH